MLDEETEVEQDLNDLHRILQLLMVHSGFDAGSVQHQSLYFSRIPNSSFKWSGYHCLIYDYSEVEIIFRRKWSFPKNSVVQLFVLLEKSLKYLVNAYEGTLTEIF